MKISHDSNGLARPPFATDVYDLDGASVARAAGEIDLSNADLFGEAVGEAARRACGPDPIVVVDLSGVGFMDCSGLRAVVEGTREFREGGGRVRVVDGGRISRLLRLIGLQEEFPVHPDAASATGHADRPAPER